MVKDINSKMPQEYFIAKMNSGLRKTYERDHPNEKVPVVFVFDAKLNEYKLVPNED